MKANAPEKIYVDSNAIGDDISTTVRTKQQDYSTCTEYIRTDALMKRAKEWLNEHTEDNDYTWYDETEHTSGITEKFIEDFLNYLKE